MTYGHKCPSIPLPPHRCTVSDEADAQTRLKTHGYNELPRANQRTAFRIVLEVLREPMLALLLGGGAIYLVLGDLKEAHHPARLRDHVES